MSNLKNVIIYLLSVLIAFESGVLLFIVGMFTVTNDLKNDRKNRSVSFLGVILGISTSQYNKTADKEK